MVSSLFAMDYDGLTVEEKLHLGRKLERMEPDNGRQIRLWQQNNNLELEIERKYNTHQLELMT
jgi:hypothetical protein